MEFTFVLSQMLMLISMLGVGFVIAKLGITNAESNKHMSRLVTYVLVSAMILHSACSTELMLGAREIIILIAASVAMHALLAAIAIAVTYMMKVDKKDAGTYRFMLMFGNAAFIGFPVVASMFGPQAVFYASIFNLPMNPLVFTLGVRFLSSGKETKVKVSDFISAPVVACIIAIIIFAFRIPVPVPVATVLNYLGTSAISLSMIIVGTSLAAIDFRSLFSDIRVIIFSLIRLLISPVIIWALARLFITDPLILGVVVTISAMPVATMTTMLCIEHGANEQLASKGVFVSTILSAATIPVIAFLLL